MQAFDEAVREREKFQAVQERALKEIDDEIAALQAKRNMVMSWGKPAKQSERKCGKCGKAGHSARRCPGEK